MLARPALTLPGCCAAVPAAPSATVAEPSQRSTMTDRVRTLLITPGDDLLTIHRRVMSTTLGTPTATSRDAAIGEPAPAGRALGATPATSPGPPGAAAPAAPALPRRIRGALPAAGPGRTVQPAAGPDLLRRVLDGLNRL